jgi:hypothetical protein
MKLRAVPLFASLLFLACNSVTVVPIDDEDAGDGGAEASTPVNDAGIDVSAPVDATVEASPADASDASDAADATDEG